MTRLIGAVALAGFLAAAAIALALWGPRPDFAQAIRGAGFWVKAGYALVLAAAGVLALERQGRPEGGGRAGLLLAIAAGAGMAVMAGSELSDLPRAAWAADLTGHTWKVCTLRIALVSAPGFAAALVALRRMAPASPRLAGAAAGLLAGGLGAAAYGLTCNEAASAFLASWYTLGMLAWAGVGAVVGPWLLRW
jgi:hypothetical protein